MTPNRLVFAAAVLLYMFIAKSTGDHMAAELFRKTLNTYIVYFAISTLIIAHIIWKPQVSVGRRLCAMISDFGMISYSAAMGGIRTGFFYPFYLWTVFGNGFRFGLPYLYTATAIGDTGLSIALTTSGAWERFEGLSVGLIACLTMLPLYASRLIRKLSEAKLQAEEANRAKTAFLANVGHDVRTPLNAIIGLGSILHGQLKDQGHRQIVSTIMDSGHSLLNLINGILDISRIESGRMQAVVEDLDIYVAMKRLKAMLLAQPMSPTLTLTTHITARTPRRVVADYTHIEQILINLAANAIKFTEKGFVVVTADGVENSDGSVRLRFEVGDTGIGIPIESQNRIFDRFVQADNTITTRFGGTGLGLAICKQLVDVMNGRIGIESTAGHGSTFWFEVDVAPVVDLMPDRETSEGKALLVSQDDSLAAQLEQLGLATVAVDSLCELEKAIQASEQRFGQEFTIFIDARELIDAQGVALQRLRADRGRGAGTVLVLEGASLSELPVPLRSLFDTSIITPLEPRAVGHALDVVNLARGNVSGGPEEERACNTAARPLSILVAEDNRTNQLVITKMLEKMGHSVTVVVNGLEALDTLEGSHFDLIILDVNMPVLNGLETAKLYRFSFSGEPYVPIVALTADATADTWARCKEAGMNGYIAKPVDSGTLFRVIEDAIAATGPCGGRTGTNKSRTGVEFCTIRDEDPINPDTLKNLERLGGDEFAAGLIAQLASDAVDMLAWLRSAVADEDVQTFREVTHALRGAAGNLGAVKLFETCLGLSGITASQMAVQGEDIVAKLASEVDTAIFALKRRSTTRQLIERVEERPGNFRGERFGRA
ncbi:MAG TPA: ATP-binding protein [Methylocella sp.]|nr:ATP-binding protein [Methylocella sp.]